MAVSCFLIEKLRKRVLFVSHCFFSLRNVQEHSNRSSRQPQCFSPLSKEWPATCQRCEFFKFNRHGVFLQSIEARRSLPIPFLGFVYLWCNHLARLINCLIKPLCIRTLYESVLISKIRSHYNMYRHLKQILTHWVNCLRLLWDLSDVNFSWASTLPRR